MEWGFMTPIHIMTLAAAALMNVGLYYALRRRSRRVQTLVLLVFSLSGIAAIVYNLLRWDAPLQYLPLHLCSVNALALPFAVVTRSKRLGNLLLLWSLGALVALVLNFEVTTVHVFDEVFNFYYFPHVFEFGIPVLLFKLGLVKKDVRCIGSTLGITLTVYTFAHLCNKIINAWCIATGQSFRVNYMFSIQPNNPLTQLFHDLVPYEYWYMLLVLPIAAVYLAAVYAPELRALYRSRRCRGAAALQRRTAH